MKWGLSFLSITGLCLLTHCLPPQYHFIGTPLPWLKAQMYCREHYTDLATIFNIEDMNRLVNTAQDSTGGITGKAWIGLHDDITSWRWSFSDNQYYGDKEGDYRNWDFSQPDNFFGDQMCVKMWSGGVWEDSRCFLRNPFICYDGTTTTDRRFIFVEQEMSWSDAQRYCRRHYTDLASVRDEKENQEIQHLAKNKGVWIGLFRTREWSDQRVSTYRNWKQGQPDNVGGKQNCTATDLGNAGLWSDEYCSRELVFICYGEKGKTPDESVLSTTVTPNKITTIEGDSATIKITSISPSKRTTTETEPTFSNLNTEITAFEQLSTKEMDQTRPITNETSDKPILPTPTNTPVILNHTITTEGHSTMAEPTSFAQLSTTEVQQTTFILEQTPHISSSSSINTVTQSKMTSTDRVSTTAEMISVSTFSKETTSDSIMSTTAMSPKKGTSTEIKSATSHVSREMTSSEQPSTPHVDQKRPITGEIPNMLTLPTTRMTFTEGDLTSEVVSSQQYSTPKLDQTESIPEHVINLQVKFTSEKKLSEDDIIEVVLVQFHNLLIEKGLPPSIKLGLKRPLKY